MAAPLHVVVCHRVGTNIVGRHLIMGARKCHMPMGMALERGAEAGAGIEENNLNELLRVFEIVF